MNKQENDRMSDMSASIQFSIKYDGPALETHEMDVRELAPALLALSSLLEESNRALNGDKPEIRVNVKGNFQSGSFKIDLSAALTFKEQLVSLLSGADATALSNLFGILGGLGLVGGGGLIGLVLWLNGRQPSRIEYKDEKAIFIIEETSETETLEVDIAVGRLYSTRVVRQSLSKVIKPLTQTGIDYFASGRDGKAEVVITQADAVAFTDLDGSPEEVSNTLTEGALLQIESAVFKDGNKWRLNDGTTSFFAEITDEDFLGQIETGEARFGKGDVLIVNLRRVQSIADTGLKSEYKIEKVREHKGPLQNTLLQPVRPPPRL
ncbi:hypothetical protein [Pusillimonas sp. ANT_WB101]|uniref:hypothetical protein n=1 Tax=Pusillimonas sp. ANT_WB101 TaxID=2597356 RepID=UPI0011EFB084|nr:hypothetical protein [Pusillimonas sp. ANT_WB101]KAA0911860.1 hypothetical protein FQ179_08755 [Pusillimonas sp. ANT_WB101]